ncbi:hypothetical protein Patl1_23150 [Pistacia atlantica]|uniref:Uncharacterized protein n=1 Tax=Pistacia atlantica TaxID=434234 RepID=A0ACC0ZX16_9ROSI|nr:hypothetical protein Patl1_23150 [Pistacia atlantica]
MYVIMLNYLAAGVSLEVDNGASSKCSFESFALSKYCFLSRNQLSSASSISSWVHLYEVKYCNYQLRTIQTFPPVCMGKRSCKIAGRKGLEMQKRQNCTQGWERKSYLRNVKKGGPSPISNMVLAAVLEKAKELYSRFIFSFETITVKRIIPGTY